MPIVEFEGKKPRLKEDVSVAPTATIIGDVEIDSRVSVWPGAVIRADFNYVRIGTETNIQDNATLHPTSINPLLVGRRVTVGHNSVLHGCTIQDECLIGMGCIVLDGVEIGEGSIVGAGAVVLEGQKIPASSLVVGVPAKVIRRLPDEAAQNIRLNSRIYVELAKRYGKYMH